MEKIGTLGVGCGGGRVMMPAKTRAQSLRVKCLRLWFAPLPTRNPPARKVGLLVPAVWQYCKVGALSGGRRIDPLRSNSSFHLKEFL